MEEPVQFKSQERVALVPPSPHFRYSQEYTPILPPDYPTGSAPGTPTTASGRVFSCFHPLAPEGESRVPSGLCCSSLFLSRLAFRAGHSPGSRCPGRVFELLASSVASAP
eukprot:scaffold7339_cov249-Pinguiococcus_pyrenoidosus.AAC.16